MRDERGPVETLRIVLVRDKRASVAGLRRDALLLIAHPGDPFPGPFAQRRVEKVNEGDIGRYEIGPDLCLGQFPCGRYWDRTSDLFRVREARYRCANRPGPCNLRMKHPRWRRDLNPCTRLCRPLPRLSATPPRAGDDRDRKRWLLTLPTRADDEIRTRDPHLGKVMRYHCATSALLAFLRAP